MAEVYVRSDLNQVSRACAATLGRFIVVHVDDDAALAKAAPGVKAALAGGTSNVSKFL